MEIVIGSTIAGTVLIGLAAPWVPKEYYPYMAAAAVILLITTGVILAVQYARGKPISPTDITADLDVYKSISRPGPLSYSDKAQLCDYSVASSAYSVIPGKSVFSYTTEESIRKVIAAGARLVELHIYDDAGKPVVGLADTITGQKYTYNTVPFEACCQVLANDAFNAGTTTASSDPFIVSLVFHTENTNIFNACADTMKTTMARSMLGSSFSYQRKIITNEPIADFAGKFIIVSGANVKGTLMDELVNLSWAGSHLRRLTYTEAAQTHDYQELIDYNKKNITMVVPDGSISLENNNPQILFTYGCQWVMMNYGSLDKGMETYTANFASASFLLKPDALRFKPVSYTKPAPQDPARSFQPKRKTSPIYDITL